MLCNDMYWCCANICKKGLTVEQTQALVKKYWDGKNAKTTALASDIIKGTLNELGVDTENLNIVVSKAEDGKADPMHLRL